MLTCFKNRVIQNAGIKAYEELFNEIITIAMEKGVKFGKLQIVDSVHTIAKLISSRMRRGEGKAKLPEMPMQFGERRETR